MSCGGPCSPEEGCDGFVKSPRRVTEPEHRPPGPLHQTADLAAAWPPYGNPHEVAVSSASIEGQPDDMAPPTSWLLCPSIAAAYEEQVGRPGSAKAGPAPPRSETVGNRVAARRCRGRRQRSATRTHHTDLPPDRPASSLNGVHCVQAAAVPCTPRAGLSVPAPGGRHPMPSGPALFTQRRSP